MKEKRVLLKIKKDVHAALKAVSENCGVDMGTLAGFIILGSIEESVRTGKKFFIGISAPTPEPIEKQTRLPAVKKPKPYLGMTNCRKCLSLFKPSETPDCPKCSEPWQNSH